MKKAVKILRDVQSYENGKIYRIHESFANSLIKRGKAEEVLQKEEKKVIETKEEKHAPEETKKEETLSIKKLSEVISGYSDQQLNDIIEKDTRSTAVKMARAEFAKR